MVVFQPLRSGAALEQADGTAWMGFYCIYMLKIALELAETDPVYEVIYSFLCMCMHVR